MNKLTVLIVVLSTLLVTASVFADAEADFKEVEELKKIGNYQQTESTLQSIITNYAGTKYALRAQRHIIYLLLERDVDAQNAVNTLLRDFSEQPDWLNALYDVAGRCEERKKYELARSIYFEITLKYPLGSSQAATGKVNLSKIEILPLIDANNISSAQAGVDKLITDFAGNVALPDVLYDIGGKYHSAGKFEQGKVLYQKVVSDYPGTKYALRAQRALVRLFDATGKQPDAQAAIDKLVTDFSYNSELPRTLNEFAQTAQRQNRYEDAAALTQIANSLQGLRDRAIAIIQLIANGSFVQAKDATDKFIVDFAENEGLPPALCDIAGKFESHGAHEQANVLYQRIEQLSPDSIYANQARFESAKANIYSFLNKADEPNASSVIDRLITDFANNSNTPAALYDIAVRYDWQNGHKPKQFTETVLNRIISTFPQSPQVRRSRLNLQRMNLLKIVLSDGDPNEVMAGVRQIAADFNDIPESAQDLLITAEMFSSKGWEGKTSKDEEKAVRNWRKAVEVREELIEHLPRSSYLAQAHYTLGVVCAQNLQDYAKGIEHFRIVIDHWPNYQYAWNAQYFIGLYTEELQRAGLISKNDAIIRTKQAYIKVLGNYPNSRAYLWSARQLGNIYFEQEMWLESAMYLDIALNKCYQNNEKSWIYPIVSSLGKCYEKMGEIESAKKVYKQYLEWTDKIDSQAIAIADALSNLQGV